MASTSRTAVTGTRLGALQIGIIVLTVATALIHLIWAMRMPFRLNMFPMIFYLNFIGYIVLLAAWYLPQFQSMRRPIRWALMGYALLTIIMYFVFSGGRFNPVAYADKVIEVALIALLYLEDRAAQAGKT